MVFNKISVLFAIVFASIMCYAYSSNSDVRLNNDGYSRTVIIVKNGCLNLEDVDQEYYHRRPELNLPLDLGWEEYLLNDTIFDESLQPYSGLACRYNIFGGLREQGNYENGFRQGTWSQKHLPQNNGYYHEQTYKWHDGVLRIEDEKYYSSHKINSHTSFIKDDFYLDTLFYPRTGAISMISHYDNSHERYFFQSFDKEGEIDEFYIKDSIYIRWEEEANSCFINGCMLDLGYCVEVVEGLGEQCFAFDKDSRPSQKEYFRNESFPEGIFINYSKFGVTDTIYIDLRKSSYK